MEGKSEIGSGLGNGVRGLLRWGRALGRMDVARLVGGEEGFSKSRLFDK